MNLEERWNLIDTADCRCFWNQSQKRHQATGLVSAASEEIGTKAMAWEKVRRTTTTEWISKAGFSKAARRGNFMRDCNCELQNPGTNGKQNNENALVTVLTVALSCSLGYARKRIRPPDPEKTHTHTHTRKKERKQESKKARKQIVR